MRIMSDSFDRDLALFDASATLTYFRLRKSQDPKPHQTISTDDLELVKKQFPRLFLALAQKLPPTGTYSLIFWPLGADRKENWIDLKISGAAHLFFISTQVNSEYLPGTTVHLNEGEELVLPYEWMLYGFLGVYRHKRET